MALGTWLVISYTIINLLHHLHNFGKRLAYVKIKHEAKECLFLNKKKEMLFQFKIVIIQLMKFSLFSKINR
jgi:hypothetical protein